MDPVIKVWKVVNILSTVLYLVLNSFVILDIYLILRNPFYSRDSRGRWHTSLSLAVFIIFGTFSLFAVFNNSQGLDVFEFE